MPSKTSIFNKGSILPSIMEIEKELIKQENEAKKLSEEKILAAKTLGDKLIEETLKKIPRIEEEEIKKIFDTVDEKTEELERVNELELSELEKNIKHNRTKALDFILNKIIPQWEGRYPI